MPWTISRNGGAATTLAAWGIEAITLNLKSFDTDELVFVIKKQDALSAATFVYGDTVALVDPSGVTRFQGKIRVDVTNASAESERVTYTAWNVWDDLKTTIYQQTRALTSTTDWITLFNKPTTQVVLFRDPDYQSLGSWQKWTVHQQINDVLTFAQANGCALSFDLSGISGANDQQSPWSEATDISCAAVLRRCQSPMADLSGYFDYTTTPPTLRCVRRSSMGTNALDLLDATKVTKIDRLRQLNDMVPPGVVFIFVTSAVNPATGKTYDIITTSSAGATSGPRVVVNTINLTQLENDSSFYTVPLALKTRNMAQDYFATLAVPWFEGQITTKQQEVDNTWHPAMIATFTHGRADWAATGAVVQLVSLEPLSGTITVRFGPPPMLGAADWVKAQIAGQFLRQGAPASTGTSGASPDGSSPSLGGTTETLILCSGERVTVLTR